MNFSSTSAQSNERTSWAKTLKAVRKELPYLGCGIVNWHIECMVQAAAQSGVTVGKGGMMRFLSALDKLQPNRIKRLIASSELPN